MAATLSRSEIARGEQSFDLPGVGWDQYVAVNDILADRPGVRMIYLDGSLTFLTLSRRHDWHSDFLDAIVKAVASVCGIEWEVAGSATFRREDLDAGLEADRAYYFGPNAEVMAGPVNVNLATQPPPDLAIEVEVSRSAVKALAIYARMGVPEVWRLDVGAGRWLSWPGTRPASISRWRGARTCRPSPRTTSCPNCDWPRRWARPPGGTPNCPSGSGPRSCGDWAVEPMTRSRFRMTMGEGLCVVAGWALILSLLRIEGGWIFFLPLPLVGGSAIGALVQRANGGRGLLGGTIGCVFGFWGWGIMIYLQAYFHPQSGSTSYVGPDLIFALLGIYGALFGLAIGVLFWLSLTGNPSRVAFIRRPREIPGPWTSAPPVLIGPGSRVAAEAVDLGEVVRRARRRDATGRSHQLQPGR